MISTSVSGEDCSASSTIASAPCSPGAAFAMRISTILRCGEQRHRAAARDQTLPVEAALDDVQLALDEALAACRRADRIRGFVDEQRLVTGHEVDRLELTGQAGREVVAGNLHFRSAGIAVSERGAKTSEKNGRPRLIRVKVGPIMAQAARRGHRKHDAAPVAAFRCIRTQISCVTGMPRRPCRASVAEIR